MLMWIGQKSALKLIGVSLPHLPIICGDLVGNRACHLDYPGWKPHWEAGIVSHIHWVPQEQPPGCLIQRSSSGQGPGLGVAGRNGSLGVDP